MEGGIAMQQVNNNQKQENLEALISKISFEIVNEKILDENEINKLLGVLSSNGVYAMWVWAKSQKNINEKNLFNKIFDLFKKVREKKKDESYESYFQNISGNIYQLLFLKQLLEKTLIYARYHAKALSGD